MTIELPNGWRFITGEAMDKGGIYTPDNDLVDYKGVSKFQSFYMGSFDGTPEQFVQALTNFALSFSCWADTGNNVSSYQSVGMKKYINSPNELLAKPPLSL